MRYIFFFGILVHTILPPLRSWVSFAVSQTSGQTNFNQEVQSTCFFPLILVDFQNANQDTNIYTILLPWSMGEYYPSSQPEQNGVYHNLQQLKSLQTPIQIISPRIMLIYFNITAGEVLSYVNYGNYTIFYYTHRAFHPTQDAFPGSCLSISNKSLILSIHIRISWSKHFLDWL